uniref:Nucleoside phosphorylase domain-containing protein n=1 Tax=Meloidogyne javanica TaxID=6303 RepID=A0A915M5T3_MELJA
MTETKEINIATTPFGNPSDVLLEGNINGVSCVILSRTTKRSQTFYDGLPGHPEGICHIPMYPTFNEKMRQILISSLSKTKLNYQTKGTLVCVEGPRFSTRAESEVFRQWKADLIGMTLCPEVVLAKELGIPYASLAAVTDYDCWKDKIEEEPVKIVYVFKDITSFIRRTNENFNTFHKVSSLDANWTQTSFLAETSEFVANTISNGNLFWNFVEECLDEKYLNLELDNDEKEFNLALKIAENLLPDGQSGISLLRLSLSLRLYSARIQLHRQIANGLLPKLKENECSDDSPFYEIHGIVSCKYSEIDKLLKNAKE